MGDTRIIKLAASTAASLLDAKLETIAHVQLGQQEKLNAIATDVELIKDRTLDVPKMALEQVKMRSEFNGHVESHREARKWWAMGIGSILTLLVKALYDMFSHKASSP